MTPSTLRTIAGLWDAHLTGLADATRELRAHHHLSLFEVAVLFTLDRTAGAMPELAQQAKRIGDALEAFGDSLSDDKPEQPW